jgi:hypothetical protein
LGTPNKPSRSDPANEKVPWSAVELDRLTFLQAAKTVGFDGGEVHEYVFAVLSADETMAFGSLNHFTVAASMWVFVFLNVVLKICAECSRRKMQAGHVVERVLLTAAKIKRIRILPGVHSQFPQGFGLRK